METPTFKNLEDSFAEYKRLSGARGYVACFGKTFVAEDHPDFALAREVGAQIVANDFGVIHGGYIGIMKGVSLGADEAIKNDSSKNTYWNIGVPFAVFDNELSRAAETNLPPAPDLLDRIKALITFCDACIVMPSAGFGTLSEVALLFHLNQLTEKFSLGKPKPMLLLGEKWQSLFQNLYQTLDMTKQSKGEDFISFGATNEDVQTFLKKI